jgi:hypothetical protein
VGESRVQRPSRVIASVLVAAFHTALVLTLVDALRIRSLSPLAERIATAQILLPAAIPPRTRTVRARPRRSDSSASPLSTRPLILTPSPPAAEPSGSTAPTDWTAAAAQAAAVRTATPSTKQQFGVFPVPADVAPAPKHHAGDHGRFDTGEHVDWIDERCYVISDPSKIAGPPDVVMQGMSFVGAIPGLHCLPEKDPSTLFEELIETFPEYKKYAPK